MLIEKRPYSGKYAPFYDYVDLDKYQDDKTVLSNPHKGWYWHYIDNGYTRIEYRDRIDPDDDMSDFPGLNHLYLRFDWSDIEKTEGVFDWSYLDEIMDTWSKRGYRFSLRACTFEGWGDATPRWVYEAGAKYIQLHVLEPVYDDPVYLEKLENFMREFGRKYNNDPRIEFVDIGTFGTWGEGHTSAGSETIYPVECIQKHIALHAKYFPDKIILLNDDMIGHRKEQPEEDKNEILSFALTVGAGARDDSVCVSSYSENFQYDTLRSPSFFDHFWKTAPVDLEFEHYHSVIARPPHYFAEGLPFIEACRRTHATYAGFHGYPRPWLEKFPFLTEYLANRLGYWYFVDGLRITPFSEGCDNTFVLRMENRGFAPAYNRFTLSFKLVNEETGEAHIFETDADNRLWMPGEITDVPIRLKTRSISSGTYSLHMRLCEGDVIIKIGMASERYEDGWYKLLDTLSVKPF